MTPKHYALNYFINTLIFVLQIIAKLHEDNTVSLSVDSATRTGTTTGLSNLMSADSNIYIGKYYYLGNKLKISIATSIILKYQISYNYKYFT